MKQELDPERLTQTQTAALIGCDRRTLARWETEHRDHGMFPRNRDGTYHLAAMHWWMVAKRIQIDKFAQSNARSARRR